MLTRPGLEGMTEQQATAVTQFILDHLGEVAVMSNVGPLAQTAGSGNSPEGTVLGAAARVAVPKDDELGVEDARMKAEDEENKRLADQMNNSIELDAARKAGRTA